MRAGWPLLRVKRAWALRVAPGCGDLLEACAGRAASPGSWSEVSGGAGGKGCGHAPPGARSVAKTSAPHLIVRVRVRALLRGRGSAITAAGAAAAAAAVVAAARRRRDSADVAASIRRAFAQARLARPEGGRQSAPPARARSNRLDTIFAEVWPQAAPQLKTAPGGTQAAACRKAKHPPRRLPVNFRFGLLSHLWGPRV